jgi:predicted helicase
MEIKAAIKSPYVHFYEDFLEEYDHDLRRSLGVFYTPLPIVKFIIRGVDSLLRNEFRRCGGLANKDVIALDFATGTGTFLLEMYKTVLDATNADESTRIKIIRDHLLKNFYGFEYMVPPYVIAHLILSDFLKEYTGYVLQETEHFGVFLTNTLESTLLEKNVPELFDATRESPQNKDKRLLVIVGNPPYGPGPSKIAVQKIKNSNPLTVPKTSNHLGMGYSTKSQTKTPGLLDEYKQIEGVPLKERNLNPLNDDYVKFIRFAQKKMEAVSEGIVAIVTNNGFLDNVTFRGMRYSLLKTFDQIRILNLHGNVRKKEKKPDGSEDAKVFEITVGVCIVFFIKNAMLKRGVFYEDLFGSREEKYRFLLEYDLGIKEGES